jgi:hypothetical protein
MDLSVARDAAALLPIAALCIAMLGVFRGALRR